MLCWVRATTHPATQNPIPEDLNLEHQWGNCKSLSRQVDNCHIQGLKDTLFWVQTLLAFFFPCALSEVPLLNTEKMSTMFTNLVTTFMRSGKLQIPVALSQLVDMLDGDMTCPRKLRHKDVKLISTGCTLKLALSNLQNISHRCWTHSSKIFL